MNIEYLKYFSELAKIQHYGKAAKALNISQPGLSHAIKSLEEEYGVPLFQKEGRNVSLSHYGKELMKDVDNPRDVEAIARELGVSYSWFRKTFKEYTGISPAQYQLQQRLLKAKEMLTGTDINISDIAYALKFVNTGQFSTFFKHKEGVTPSDFRKRNSWK